VSSLLKRTLGSSLALTAVRLLTPLYRFLHFGGVRMRHDAALSAFLATSAPAVFACWHQDFFYTVGYLSRVARRRPTRVLASASRDGGLMVAAAESAGFRGAIRGSSARGGAGALRALRRAAAQGRESLVIVCDGPRPPAFVLQAGALSVAAESGLPLWLVRTSYRPAKVLERSWARFVVPSLFARGVVLAEGPIFLPQGLARADLETQRLELERRLLALARRADLEAERG
jgi:lysophospholipid acyltransferase (LPLAT)-like uncharacterized protein